MRLRSVIMLLIVFGVLGGGGYVAYLKRDMVLSYFKKGKQVALGFTPARTADEAIDKFKEAVKKRDYDSAAIYCTGEYAEQLRRANDAAGALGTAIDNMFARMEQEGVKSDKCRLVLKLLEPFPSDIKVVKEKQSEDKWIATITEDYGSLHPFDFGSERWNVDLKVFRALAGGPSGYLSIGLPVKVEVIPEGQGDKKVWRLNFPVDSLTRARVDELRDKYKNYVRALQKLDVELRTEPVTKNDLEGRLRTELEEAK